MSDLLKSAIPRPLYLTHTTLAEKGEHIRKARVKGVTPTPHQQIGALGIGSLLMGVHREANYAMSVAYDLRPGGASGVRNRLIALSTQNILAGYPSNFRVPGYLHAVAMIAGFDPKQGYSGLAKHIYRQGLTKPFMAGVTHTSMRTFFSFGIISLMIKGAQHIDNVEKKHPNCPEPSKSMQP